MAGTSVTSHNYPINHKGFVGTSIHACHVTPAATQHPKSTASVLFKIFEEKFGAYIPLKDLCGEIWYPCTADFTMECCAVKKNVNVFPK